MEPNPATIIGGLILACVLWLMRGTAANTTALAVLDATLKDHVMPELKKLREAGHDVRDHAQEAVSKADLLKQRVDQNERNIELLWDGRDRRTGTERRDA